MRDHVDRRGDGPGRMIRRHAQRAGGFVTGARVIDAMDDQQRLGNEQPGEQGENANALPAGTEPGQHAHRTCPRYGHLARESPVVAQA
jgi:hypothetical protein